METNKIKFPLGLWTTRSMTRSLNTQKDDRNKIQEKEVIGLEELDKEKNGNT